MVKKFDDMFIRFDRVLACDRQTDDQTGRRTDGQTETSCHGIVRAMHTRRRAYLGPFRGRQGGHAPKMPSQHNSENCRPIIMLHVQYMHKNGMS